jgi:uncharacterized metal-binding protein
MHAPAPTREEELYMNEGDFLRCLMHVVGRVAIPTKEVRAIVDTGKNRVKAFNLFDGSHTIQEVANKTKIDQGNLSRAAARWVKQGIAFWIGKERDARLLHIYAIPEKERRGAQ